MTYDELIRDEKRQAEVQRDRERLSREMEREVERIRNYIRTGHSRPPSTECDKSR